MGQLVFKYFPNVQVKYQLTNRSRDICLRDYISKPLLIKKFEKIKKLKINDEELSYLKTLKIFSSDYLEFLKKVNLPEITVTENNKDYRIEIIGLWSQAIYWETFVLSTLTELYCLSIIKKQNQSKDNFIKEGKRRLNNKISKLKKYPAIKFADFGTRRRFNFQWQKYVLETVKKDLPDQLVGTSNVLLAKELNLKPVGTFAHEIYMVLYALDQDITGSHQKVLDLWWREYGDKLSTALTDNYGSDFFFNNFSNEQASNWQGLRHDSGDPIKFGEKAINFYKKLGINPKKKLIIFSDSLNVDLMIKIYKHFNGRIKILFGWGTDLTNDLGFKIPQIVFKAVEANGQKTAKLTDVLTKATGHEETISYFKKKLSL
jgi:nicotinate phosphoribosyltransferase